VALLDLSYDDPDGAYAGGSGSVVATSERGLKPLALQFNAGYAKSISPKLTLDAGIVHAEYSTYSRNSPGHSYTEVYAGFTHEGLSGRLSFSPYYFHSGNWTLYGEVADVFKLGARLQLNAHVGLLAPVRNSRSFEQHPEFDWRIGLTRRFGPLSAQVAWTGGRRLRSYRANRIHTGDALVVGLSLIL